MQDAGYRLIPLGRTEALARLDQEDSDHLGHIRWHVDTDGYAAHRYERNGTRHSLLLHREILGLVRGDGVGVDHVNGNRLDCRRSNLRLATKSQNGQNRVGLATNNTSGFRGVSWNKQHQRWESYATIQGRRHRLGLFTSRESAAKAAASFRAQHMPFATD